MANPKSAVATTLTFEDIEREINRLMEFIDLYGAHEEWADYAVERLAVEYDLDLSRPALLYPPSQRGAGAEMSVLGKIRSAQEAAGMKPMPYEVLDAAVELVAVLLTSQPDHRAAAVWATNRLIARADIRGVVHDPTDAVPATAAARHLSCARRLIDRDQAVKRGEEDAPF